VHIVKMRLAAFVLSAALVGMGGGLYAQFLGILTVDPFYLDLSFITIAMLVVGGMSSLTGAVAGVLVVTLIVEVLRLLERGVGLGHATFALPQGSQEIGLGILMALILIFRPNGLSGGREIALIGRAAAKRGLAAELQGEQSSGEQASGQQSSGQQASSQQASGELETSSLRGTS